MIKTVIFDVDDTMYSYQDGNKVGMEAMEQYVRKYLGRDAEEFRTAYEQCQAETKKRLGVNNAAAHSRHIWIQEMLEQWQVPLFPHIDNLYRAYWGSILDWCRPNPGLPECLKKLKKAGIRIGIGSDMTTHAQYEKIKHLGAAPYVDFIVTSQEAGVEKPHRDFWKLCLQKANAQPEECMFIGDNFRKDVAGSAGAGMKAVWYNPDKKSLPARTKAAAGSYMEITNFEEILSVIEGC